MSAKKDSSRSRRRSKPASRAKQTNPPFDPSGLTEEQLQGPPARETTVLRSDREREVGEELAAHTATSPKLTGGDIDADWQRAATVGEEAVGGTVATPDQSVVDELGAALGVPRAPDEAFRTSQEILDGRDRHRWEEEDTSEPSDARPT